MTFTNRLFRRLFPDDRHHGDGFTEVVQTHMIHARNALDLGCGDNSILAPYRSAEREVWGTDFAAHPRLKNGEWFRLLGSDGKIPFPDATFDLVVCVSVLEHVTDGLAFFSEVSRVLKPSGHFIGHAISGNHYVTWISRTFGLFPHAVNQWIIKTLSGRDEIDTFPAFYRLNTESTIDSAARAAGLTRVALLRYPDQGYFSFWKPLLPPAIVLDWMLAQVSSSMGRLYFTVVLQKAASVPQANERLSATDHVDTVGAYTLHS